MAVQHAFRATGRARRVEDHLHRVRGNDRQLVNAGRTLLEQGRVRGVTGWLAAHHDDLGGRSQLTGDAVHHGEIVVLPKLLRHEDDLAVHIVEDEQQLTVAKGRQDGVDRHPRHRGAEIDDGGFVPVRQHERHDAACRHSRQQCLCQSIGLGCTATDSPGGHRRRRVPSAAASAARLRGANRPVSACH